MLDKTPEFNNCTTVTNCYKSTKGWGLVD